MTRHTATWLAGGASLLLTLVLVPVMMLVARRLNMIDRPTHRKIHSEPVPFLGGVAMLLGFAGGAGLFLFLSQYFRVPLRHVELTKSLLVLGAAGLAAALGLADDRFLLRPRYKLAGQFLIALAFVVCGYHFRSLRLPGIGLTELSLLGPPLTILWMLTVVNGMNLIDGVDGLAGSVALVILLITGLMAVYLHDVVVAGLVAAAIAAVFAFLLFNWHPARIYMGDAGSLGLGMLIATSLVGLGQDCLYGMSTGSSEPFFYEIPLATAVAAYPVLEVLLTVARRLLRGKPIGSADKGHIHHRLLYQGWQAPHICFAAVLLCLLAGGAVVYSLMQYRGAAAWFLVIGGLAVGVGLHFTGLLDVFRLSVIRDNRPHFQLANHFVAMQRIKLGLVESAADLNVLLAQTCLELGIRKLTVTIANGNDPAKSRTFTWERPQESGNPAPAPALAQPTAPLTAFSDTVERPNSSTKAEWSFQPNASEEDVDVEHRVLMSDFMHLALTRAEQLYPNADRAQLEAPASPDAASHPALLLWRHNGKCAKYR